MQLPTTEQFTAAFDEYRKLKGYIETLTQEQIVECAFGAGYSLGLRDGAFENLMDVKAAIEAAKKVGLSVG